MALKCLGFKNNFLDNVQLLKWLARSRIIEPLRLIIRKLNDNKGKLIACDADAANAVERCMHEFFFLLIYECIYGWLLLTQPSQEAHSNREISEAIVRWTAGAGQSQVADCKCFNSFLSLLLA